MLKRLYADNYRSLVNFEFFPAEQNLLLGENGSGKSCVFEVLEGIQDIVLLGRGVAETFPSSTLTRWETRDVQRFELEVEGEGGAYLYTLEVEHNRKTSAAIIRREQIDFQGKPIFRYEARTVHLYNDQFKEGTSFQGDSRRSFLAIVEERPENQKLMWFKRFVGSIWVFRPNPFLMTAVSKAESLWLERDGSNLASFYRAMVTENPAEVDALKTDMREILIGLQHFRLLSSGGTAKDLVATLAANAVESGARYELSIDELSLGQRALVALYVILHFAVPRAKVLCLDEPDNFLALREIQPWLLKLSAAIEGSRCQLILISHHPEVIDYLASGNAFKFERPAGDITRVRPFVLDLESGLKASEAIARGWDNGAAEG